MIRSARSPGRENQSLERNRRRQQALIGADLMKFLAVRKTHRCKIAHWMRSARGIDICAVRLPDRETLCRSRSSRCRTLRAPMARPACPKPDSPAARPCAGTDRKGPGDLIGSGAANSEHPRRRRAPEIPAQSRIYVQPVDAHGVIVIPQHRRFLIVRIMIGRRFSGRVPVLRLSVAFRTYLRAVNVDHRPSFGLVGFRAVQTMIDREKDGGREARWPTRSAASCRCAFRKWDRAKCRRMSTGAPAEDRGAAWPRPHAWRCGSTDFRLVLPRTLRNSALFATAGIGRGSTNFASEFGSRASGRCLSAQKRWRGACARRIGESVVWIVVKIDAFPKKGDERSFEAPLVRRFTSLVPGDVT